MDNCEECEKLSDEVDRLTEELSKNEDRADEAENKAVMLERDVAKLLQHGDIIIETLEYARNNFKTLIKTNEKLVKAVKEVPKLKQHLIKFPEQENSNSD